VETKVARAFQRVKTGTNFSTIFMRWKARATVTSIEAEEIDPFPPEITHWKAARLPWTSRQIFSPVGLAFSLAPSPAR
jgi:hypothetical protein